MQIFGFLGSLLGYVLWGAFYLLKDFGLSIIVFTIIVRLCMFPFTIKQQKSMAGTARLSKKQKEIQEKYKNNSASRMLSSGSGASGTSRLVCTQI